MNPGRKSMTKMMCTRFRTVIEERQMGLTPLKRALLTGGLPMTYKVHNLGAPQ